MDSWSDKQITMMRAGGNDKCVSYLAAAGVSKQTPIAQKYNSPAALLYKERSGLTVILFHFTYLRVSIGLSYFQAPS